MPYNVIVGRNESDKKRLGERGTIFIGKNYVKMGPTTSLSNNILLDVASSHIVLVSGKRGSGKSFSLSAIAEEMVKLPEEVSKNLAVLMFDTMGIFWTMKYPNLKQEKLLQQWNIKPEGLNINLFVPYGSFNDYKNRGIPVDNELSIKTAELTTSDWCSVFDISLTDSPGILIDQVITELAEESSDYGIDDIVTLVKSNSKAEHKTKDLVESFFSVASNWGLFKKYGTKIEDLVKAGEVTVLDLSPYTNVSGNWSIKSLIIGLISKKLLNQRISSRKSEEVESIGTYDKYFEGEDKLEQPLVWLMVDECLPYKCEIITDKAHTRIGDIVNRSKKGENFEVLSFDTNKKEFLHKKVKRVFKKEKRDLIKIRTETGRELICTPEHRVLTRYGFASAVSVPEIGSIAIQHYSKNYKLTQARIVGHLFGDGWTSEKTKSLGFSGKKSDLDLQKIKEDLKIMGFKSSKITTRRTKSKITDDKGIEHFVNGVSKSIGASTKAFRYFKKLGTPIGDKATQKYLIPKWLLKATNKEKIEFLGAYMGSDGKNISQSSTAKSDFNPIRLSFNKLEKLEKKAFKFANQLKYLFESLGIKVSSIAKRPGNIRKNGDKTIKIVLTLAKSIKNTLLFLEKIGYRYCKEKEMAGYKWLAYLKAKEEKVRERLKIKENITRLHKKGFKLNQISKQLSIPLYYVKEWTRHDRKIRASNSFDHFDKWIKKRYQTEIIFEKIKNIEILEKEEVYDLEVEDLHNFVANGFIVHNCHEFLPRTGSTPATDALIQILREGRQPGISLIAATQQPGEIHKDVITQSDVIISHRLTSKIDLEALNQMMQTYLLSDIQGFMNDLPKVKGSAILLDDNSERIYPIQIKPKRSWHGGDSPSAIKERRQLII